jgi:hypothetical protein
MLRDNALVAAAGLNGGQLRLQRGQAIDQTGLQGRWCRRTGPAASGEYMHVDAVLRDIDADEAKAAGP